MTRTAIFDFGGVLFRWQPDQLLMDTLPAHAPTAERAQALAAELFQSFNPASDWAQFDLGLIDEGLLAARIAARTGLPEADVRRLIDAVPAHLAPQPGAVATMRALKAAGHRVVFLSNMPRPYAEALERANPFIAEFDDGLFSARVGLMKPWPAMFELARCRFGLRDDPRPVFIDDHVGNVEAGRRHGWDGIRFVNADDLHAELRRSGWLPG
jgi:HAD superfamily hydrolase (TIGR01509 family)